MIPSELFHILFGLAIGCIWAVGERSLRKSITENYNRACNDATFYRDLWRYSVKADKKPAPKQRRKSKR